MEEHTRIYSWQKHFLNRRRMGKVLVATPNRAHACFGRRRLPFHLSLIGLIKKGPVAARALYHHNRHHHNHHRVLKSPFNVRCSINKSHLPIGIEIMIPFLVVCLFGVGAMRKVSLSGLAAEGRRRHRDNEWGTMFNSSDP